MILKRVKQRNHLVGSQENYLLEQLLRIWSSNETRDVDIDESCHQVLTVEAIHDPSMTRNDVSKVFDLEGSLESTGKEASEGTDD